MTRIVLLRNLFRNLGDEAMLACEVTEIQKRFPAASLQLLVDEPGMITEYSGVTTSFSDITLLRPRPSWIGSSSAASPGLEAPAKLWAKAMAAAFENAPRSGIGLPAHVRTFRENISEADVIVSGGSLMPSFPVLHRARSSVFRFANRLNKPLVLSGQSLYPFDRDSAPYRLATRIVLRDDSFSRGHALAAGLKETQLVDGVDPAFALPTATAQQIDAALADLGLPPDVRYIAVNLRSGKIPIDIVAQAVRSAVRSKRVDGVILFGMQRYRKEHDDRMLQAFAENAGDLPMYFAGAWGAPLLKGVLSRAQAVFASRYHAAVFSLTSGVPAVSLSAGAEYDWKLQGIYHQFRHPEWLTSPEHLESELLKMLDNRERLSIELRDRSEELAPLTSRLVETLEETIHGDALVR